VVGPAPARLRHQRQLAEPPQPLVRGRRARRVGRPHADRPLVGRGHHRHLGRVGHHLAEAHREREQVTYGDRALGRHGVVERRVEPGEHPPAGELGEQVVDRVVEPQHALLDQHQRGDRGDRLGHRGDPEDRVPGDRRAADRPRAQADHLGPAAPVDQRDQPRDGAAIDMPGEHAPEPLDPGLGEVAHEHRT
jgi:hypothetical protein